MKRLWRLLRSRTLAIWAILAFAAYAALGTAVPGGDWSAPYHSPVFLAICALLAASTTLCAWERTRAAMKGARMRPASEATIARLRDTAPTVIDLPDCRDCAGAVERTMRSLRMRVERHGDVIEARAGAAGAFGSPVFHWALAGLFVVVALGQLTRAEGQMGVIAGTSKPDAPESYGTLETGAFAGALSGRIIAVPAIESSYMANGVEQGVTPFVEIRSPDNDVLASGYAYANHPIRYRGMLVHATGNGLGAVLLVSGQGSDLTQEVLLDYTEDRSGVEPAVVGIEGQGGVTLATLVLDPPADSTPDRPAVRLRAVAGEGTAETSATIEAIVPEGGQLEVPGGFTVTVVELAKYARLSVVDDWSVYYIYALFVLAAIGLVLAVFTPLRRARVLVVHEMHGGTVYLAVRHARGDPHFPGRVEAALRDALETKED